MYGNNLVNSRTQLIARSRRANWCEGRVSPCDSHRRFGLAAFDRSSPRRAAIDPRACCTGWPDWTAAPREAPGFRRRGPARRCPARSRSCPTRTDPRTTHRSTRFAKRDAGESSPASCSSAPDCARLVERRRRENRSWNRCCPSRSPLRCFLSEDALVGVRE